YVRPRARVAGEAAEGRRPPRRLQHEPPPRGVRSVRGGAEALLADVRDGRLPPGKGAGVSGRVRLRARRRAPADQHGVRPGPRGVGGIDLAGRGRGRCRGPIRRGPAPDAPGRYDRRAAHFFQVAGSASILMKTPPTTERAWKPRCLASWVQYQSVRGTRLGLASANLRIGSTIASKSFRDSARVAVQTIQSSLVYLLRLSSGRPNSA